LRRHVCINAFGALPALLALCLLLAACATVPPKSDIEARAAYEEANDPLEPLNRVTFRFNQLFEGLLLRPIAKVYRFIVPKPLRIGIRNALDNLKSPVTFTNDLLQGEAKRGGITLGRFIVNSTLGLAGLIDVAADMGLERHSEDFGQTLAVWGIGEGPYFVWPILGPSSVRDSFGRVATVATDPLFWLLRDTDIGYLSFVRAGIQGIDKYERNEGGLAEMRRSSIDFYATVRSAWRQNRNEKIRNGRLAEPELPDYLFEDEEPSDGAADESKQD